MKVKVLTVKQPWAHLIIHGYDPCTAKLRGRKNIENRTWSTNYRGPLYIHASALSGFDWEAMKHSVIPMWGVHEIAQCYGLYGKGAFDKSITANLGQFGAIIGYVDLIGVTQDWGSSWAEPGLYHWVLANPVAIDPIPVRGQLGIWEYEISH